jgi:drug/metabolite transporter (DMT)-like permease
MTTITPTPVSRLRRVVVAVIAVAFSLAAIGGIIVLLGGTLGETGSRVLTTTSVVGAFSVAVLCCAVLLGRPLQPFGVLGVAVSVIAGIFVVWTVWFQDSFADAWDTVNRIIGTASVLAAAFALASLLLLLADRRRPPVRIGLIVTLVLLTVGAAMFVFAFWNGDVWSSDVFSRALGVVSILVALGAIVVPVMALLTPDARPGALSHAAASRLESEAHRRGITPDALVAELLAASTAPSSQEDR